MKPTKMLGLAALGALMAMAFVGASSAMASSTQLCTTDTTPCGGAVTHVHETTLLGSPALFLNSLGNIKCDVLFLSTSVGALASPQIIEGAFTYSLCSRKKPFGGEESCTALEKNFPPRLKVLREGHETARVTDEGEIEIRCGSLIQCTYSLFFAQGTAHGPLLSFETNGETAISEQTLAKTSGAFCPETGNLDITTTPLIATYISS